MDTLKKLNKNITIFLGGVALGTVVTWINTTFSILLMMVILLILFGWPFLRSKMKKNKEKEV